MEKNSKNRLAQFEQLNQIVELLKQIRSRKLQISKKSIDQHLKYFYFLPFRPNRNIPNIYCLNSIIRKMQEEVLTSVSEIDKTRKLYFDDEHMAKQARDKEEKYAFLYPSIIDNNALILHRIKKRKGGLFSSLTSLQTKKEKTSAHREASDIQSTQVLQILLNIQFVIILFKGSKRLHNGFGRRKCTFGALL